LDTRHSKTKAYEISIERAENSGISWGIFFLGFLLSAFGFLIYFLVPLALLTFNFTLLLNIFFALLLGMIFGILKNFLFSILF
jgi:hypothetical protein